MDDALIAGRYRLLDRHAIGGMATVWRAKDERTGEIVAIKRLHPHVVADPVARSRLEREAAALRAVDHPAIVRPRELIDDPEAPALVMDFVAGRPLDERIAMGPLPPDEAVAIIGVVADALGVAHAHGIVHRDIKPANILVDDDGAVHLVDFGIAALTDVPSDDLTAASTMVGTLRYAAPERLEGGESSPRSDVWALGAVLFEMITGRPAVSAVDPVGALAASRAAPPPLDELPVALAGVVSRAMATDPADRYPDAIALRDALSDIHATTDTNPDPDAVTAVVPLMGATVGGAAAPEAAGMGIVGARPRVAGRWIGLAIGVLVAATAIFAMAAQGPRTTGGGVVDTGQGSGAVGSSAPTTRATVPAAKSTPSATPAPAKAKGKGRHHSH
jgi:eukaryotic-like serine/threonine-protein kinase